MGTIQDERNFAAPLDELVDVWEIFQEQHIQNKKVPKVMLSLLEA